MSVFSPYAERDAPPVGWTYVGPTRSGGRATGLEGVDLDQDEVNGPHDTS